MTQPTVTEITRSLEEVAHDTFIDDLIPRVLPLARRARRQPVRRSSCAPAAPAPAERYRRRSSRSRYELVVDADHVTRARTLLDAPAF